ncbi:hypothetical protein [Streptomyces tendae]
MKLRHSDDEYVALLGLANRTDLALPDTDKLGRASGRLHFRGGHGP